MNWVHNSIFVLLNKKVTCDHFALPDLCSQFLICTFEDTVNKHIRCKLDLVFRSTFIALSICLELPDYKKEMHKGY